jgi:hypothetical protein
MGVNGVLEASPLDHEVQKKLSALNADYKVVTGRKAEYFFCPIVYRDDPVDLCKAHIINSSFRDSDHTWTVQRTDVDKRFGSILESDFVKLQHRGKQELIDVLTEPGLAKRLRPKFMLEGKEVSHFVADGPVPKVFSRLFVESRSGSARLALKLSPEETLAALQKDWQVEIRADFRLQAVGSLLKAAHLTLFEIMGYRYALSAGGHFVGHTILGDFFLSTLGATKRQALETAREHFLPFVNLVRPMLSPPNGLQGTVTDRLLYLCMQGTAPWAIAVLVRTGETFHAVLIPVFEEAERSARFVRFMDNPVGSSIEVNLARFAGDHWEVSPTPNRFLWPEPNFT